MITRRGPSTGLIGFGSSRIFAPRVVAPDVVGDPTKVFVTKPINRKDLRKSILYAFPESFPVINPTKVLIGIYSKREVSPKSRIFAFPDIISGIDPTKILKDDLYPIRQSLYKVRPRIFVETIIPIVIGGGTGLTAIGNAG